MQIENKLEEIPEEIKGMDERVEQLEVDFQNASKEMNNLLVMKKEKDNDVLSIEEEIKKHQKELNSLKSNEAYSALLKEIENCNKKKEEIENEQLGIMEKEEQFIINKDKRHKELDEKKAVFNGKKKELEDEIQRLNNLLAETQSKRSDAARGVEDTVLVQYDRIRVKKRGIGIVPLEEEACGGCHMIMTPQEVSDVIRGQDTIVCSSCMRIVYFDEKKEEQQNKDLQNT